MLVHSYPAGLLGPELTALLASFMSGMAASMLAFIELEYAVTAQSASIHQADGWISRQLKSICDSLSDLPSLYVLCGTVRQRLRRIMSISKVSLPS
jgi:hypothetical protein